MKTRIPCLISCLIVCLLLFSLSTALADRSVLMTFTGDVTLGSEDQFRSRATSFDSYAEEYGYDYFMKNYMDLFETDDITIVNLEGVLSDTTQGFKKKSNSDFNFRGPTAFTEILNVSSIEICNTSNNHAQDYGTVGYDSTLAALDQYGVSHFGYGQEYIYEKDGIRILFFGLNSTVVNKYRNQVCDRIKELKGKGEIQAAIVTLHTGTEYGKRRNGNQENWSRMFIDAGADLIIMHHPHVLLGLDQYKDRLICYSLGNFCFGGNASVKKPEALGTAAFRIRMDFSDDGEFLGQQLDIYPGYTTDSYPENHYQPIRVTDPEDVDYVMGLIQRDTKYDLAPYDATLGYAPQPYLPAR
ncbi:MAG: CapA family protein [Clostridia bacterium]|nr:CapA family protein [Clostridia bacterium]